MDSINYFINLIDGKVKIITIVKNKIMQYSIFLIESLLKVRKMPLKTKDRFR